jgi:nucleotide-binding universal stress UspA family protein
MSDERTSGERPMVVAGFDGSQSCMVAIEVAAREVRQRVAALTLVHAFTWPLIYPPLLGDFDPADPLPRVRARHRLDQAVEQVRQQQPDLRVDGELVDGAPAAVLVDFSRRADLVVLGHRGEGGFAELLAGSVAIHTAAHAECPVLVVRGTVAKPDAPVVVGVDGSEPASRALEFAFATANRRNAPLMVMAVWPPGMEHRTPGHPEMLLTSLGPCLLEYPDVLVDASILHDRSPAGALIRATEGAGLVVVGSRGLGGLRGLLLGSVGRALIEHAPCPVAIVRTA